MKKYSHSQKIGEPYCISFWNNLDQVPYSQMIGEPYCIGFWNNLDQVLS
jgi:hypothetical protein